MVTLKSQKSRKGAYGLCFYEPNSNSKYFCDFSAFCVTLYRSTAVHTKNFSRNIRRSV